MEGVNVGLPKGLVVVVVVVGGGGGGVIYFWHEAGLVSNIPSGMEGGEA